MGVIYSYNQYLLRVYFVPGIAPGTEQLWAELKKCHTCGVFILVGRERIKNKSAYASITCQGDGCCELYKGGKGARECERLWGHQGAFWYGGHFGRNLWEVMACARRVSEKREFQEEGRSRTKVQREGAGQEEQGTCLRWRQGKEGRWEGMGCEVSWDKPCEVRT